MPLAFVVSVEPYLTGRGEAVVLGKGKKTDKMNLIYELFSNIAASL